MGNSILQLDITAVIGVLFGLSGLIIGWLGVFRSRKNDIEKTVEFNTRIETKLETIHSDVIDMKQEHKATDCTLQDHEARISVLENDSKGYDANLGKLLNSR